MTNIIQPGNWEKTYAEERGFSVTDHGCMQTGTQFGAEELRADSAAAALQKIARMLWGLKQAMADAKWNDSECVVVVEAQIRNMWTEIDGEWVEKGSKEWLEKTIKKSTPT